MSLPLPQGDDQGVVGTIRSAPAIAFACRAPPTLNGARPKLRRPQDPRLQLSPVRALIPAFQLERLFLAGVGIAAELLRARLAPRCRSARITRCRGVAVP